MEEEVLYGDKVLLDFEEHCQPGFAATAKFQRLPTKAVNNLGHCTDAFCL